MPRGSGGTEDAGAGPWDGASSLASLLRMLSSSFFVALAGVPGWEFGSAARCTRQKKKNLGIVFLPVGSPGALAERKELLRFSVSEENEPSENNVILMFLCLLPSIPMRVCANIPATEQK